ncbi:MAG: PKD domain-containing protein, partial [Alistipes sp.]|nr:PKD domain-containing protein [Alistipes sp.]
MNVSRLSIEKNSDVGYIDVDSGTVIVKNNITANKIQTTGSNIAINGNVDCDQFDIQNFNDIRIDGDLTTKRMYFNIDNEKTSSLFVGGNLDCDIVSSYYGNSGVANFTLEAAGNVTINEGMRLMDGSDLIFSGKNYQEVYLGADCYFETVTVRNTSEEGMFINQPVSCKDFTNETNCKITYGQEGGVYGWTLRQDTVIYGDLNLVGGNLDLNGYRLTVTGNFYQNGGKITSTKYSYERLKINGSYYYQPQEGGDNTLTAGTMEIGGNFIQNAGEVFATGEDYTVCFSSAAEQHINAPEAVFGTLEFTNRSTAGIVADSTVYAKNIIVTDCRKITGENIHLTENGVVTGTYPGDLTLDGQTAGNIEVDGTLTVAGKTDISGMEIHAVNLVVTQPLRVNDGFIVVEKNMTVTGDGILYMEHEAGNVVVGGNFTAMGKECDEAVLTAGTLEVKGNFIQRKNNTFFTGGSHRTLLSGRGVQTVTITDEENSIFNILVIKKNIKTGYIFANGNNQVYREIVYDYVDVEPPAPVSGIRAEKITTTEIVIAYDAAEDDIETLGYEIYRDGERIAVTMDLNYHDKGLIPGKEYLYQVYPYDIYNNLAAEAEKFRVSTMEDTTLPNPVDTVFVSSRSRTDITLEWGIPYDDSGIACYDIYRNGELFVSGWQETTYCDRTVETDREYRYEICAVDLGGNRSEQGNSVLTKPVLPRVLSVTPQDRTATGGIYTDILIILADDNNLSEGELAFYYRKGDEGEYKPVSAQKTELVRNNATSYRGAVRFDLSQITENGDYELKAVITDNGNNKTDYIFRYYIDVEAPDKVELTTAEAENQTVRLSWEICDSGDCEGYYIYRKDEETDFVRIAVLKDRFDTTYTDKKTETDKIYTYAITAYDPFGNESGLSDTITVTVDPDREAPVIVSLSPADGTYGRNIRMEVSAQDNIAVTKAAVYYRKNETEAWEKITERYVASGYACLDFTMTELTEGSYDFMVKVSDGAGNESEGSVRRYTIDLTGPEKPVITQTVSQNTAVQLIWDFEQKKDFSHFVVERKILGAFIPVGKEYNTLGYTVTGLQPDTGYTFRVTAYDIYGNAGEPSEEIVVTTGRDTVLPTIHAQSKTKAEAVSGLVDVSMRVYDDVGIKEGRFSFSYDGITFKDTVTIPGNGGKEQLFSTLYPVKNGYEGKLWIQYEAEDTSGNVNERAVQEFVVDITPPEPVQDFRIVSNLGNIELSWKSSAETGITYNLYRSVGESDVYRLIAEGLDGSSYSDGDVKVRENYAYRIEAVDPAGNKSGQTNPVMAVVTKDTVSPIVRGVGPAKSMIGNNTLLSVLVTDNYRVSRVRVSYRNEAGEEYRINEFVANEEEFYQEFLWDTGGLESGTYVICVLAWDEDGNTSSKYERTYTLDAQSPKKPDITAEGGHFENKITIDSEKSQDFAYYEILRREIGTEEFVRIRTTTEQSFTDTSAVPFVTYVYAVKEYDKAGNAAQSDECPAAADNVDVVEPRAFLPEYMSAIEGKESIFDANLSSDNVGIVRYQWNMGDGSKYTDSIVNHAYKKAGQYTVSLTVWDNAGNSSTAVAVVYVRNRSNSGNVNINVYGENGSALGGAYVFIETGNGESYTLQADSMGRVCLADTEGTYEISVYSAGYLPECQKIEIKKNQESSLNFRLVKDEVIKGNVSVRRLTVAELIAKGVDISNPANYNTFSFTVDLYFKKCPIPTQYEFINCPYLNSTEGGNSPSVSGSPAASIEADGYTHSVYVQPVMTEEGEEPVYVILTISESIRWLKDIYEVSAEIVNSAGEKFSLEDMNAVIDLPEGLSFAGTYKGQKADYPLGTLTSGQSKTADWLIKADKGGQYKINVAADGILMPFAVPVSALFSVEREFKADGDGLIIYVMAENCAYIGENYYVQYAVYNGTGKDLYNFATTMGDFHFEEERTDITVKQGPFSDGYKVSTMGEGQTPQITYVLDSTKCGTCTLTYGRENYTIGVFPAGETLYGTYSCVFHAEGNPEEEYYKLVKYIVDTVGEETGVRVVMQTIPSHITKYNLKMIDLGFLFADPVDTTTGAYLDRIGVVETSGGSNISLNLDYNSMMTENGGELGAGWYHNYQERIEDQNGVIYYYATPGQRTTFVSDEMKQGVVYGNLLEDGTTILVDGSVKYPGRFTTGEAGLSDYYFMRGEDGLCSLYTPDGTVRKFDEQGRLREITDNDERSVALDYTDGETVIQDMVTKSRIVLVRNADGCLSQIRDELGNTATLTYENGLLASYTDFAGYTVTYRYDVNKKLIEKTSVEQTVTNSYDEKGRILSQTNANGTISMRYEDGTGYHKTTLTDYQGNVSVIETDGNYNRTAYVDPLGNRAESAYDDMGNLIRETDSLGNVITYEYTSRGYVTKRTDENNTETVMTYDEAGNVLSVQDEGGIAQFAYDDKNHLIRAAYANGKIRTYTYDKNGYLAEDTIEGLGSQKYHFENGRLKQVTDTLGNKTTMEYDAMGNVVSQTDAYGNTVTYTYDSMGRTSTVTNPLGETLRFEYDYSGNIIKTVYPDGTYTASTYDVNNCAVTTTDRAGNVTKYIRDSYGRILKKEYPDGTFETYAYDALGNETAHTDILGRTTTYTYDSASRMILRQDPEGKTTAYEYYNTGKLKKQTNSDGTWESYVYDNMGNLTEASTPLGTTYYTYDIMGNVTSVTDALGVTTTYTYDKYDRLTAETDGNQNTTTYAYNAAGNCIGKTLPDKTHVKMTYDAFGRMTSVSTVTSAYGEVSVKYEYDALGRVTKLTDELGETSTYEYDAYGNVMAVYDGTGTRQAAYTYDVMGNVLTETDASGKITQGTYDTRTGQLVSMVHNVNTVNEAKYTYTYDKAGRLVSVTDPLLGTSSYTYDKTGNIETLTDPNGGVTKYTYDAMGKITEICNAVGSTSRYQYDENGLLLVSENARGQKTDYTYDALGRTVSFTDEAGSVKYFYDNNGNLLSVTETLPEGTTQTITRTYDCMNRVTAYTDHKGNTIRYGYDELGNLLTLTYAGGEIIRYAYYPNGLLKSVTDTKGNITSYEYDTKGNVTKTKNADGTEETRSYNGSNKLTVQETKNAAGAVLSRYEYTYDENGNVTRTTGIDHGDIKKITEAEYKYDADNRLIGYNGKEVQYDKDGN